MLHFSVLYHTIIKKTTKKILFRCVLLRAMEKSNIRSYDDQRSIGYVSVVYIDVLGCALLRKTMYAYDIWKVYDLVDLANTKYFCTIHTTLCLVINCWYTLLELHKDNTYLSSFKFNNSSLKLFNRRSRIY